MTVIFALTIVLSFLLGETLGFTECGIQGSRQRIIGGKDASLGEFPWQVSLRKRYKSDYYDYAAHNCGGAIVGEKWILTAAHCVQHAKQSERDLTIRVGDLRLYDKDVSETDFYPERILIHDKWNATGKLENDIALIQVKGKIDFSTPYVGAICLPSKAANFRGAKNCMFSGWGLVYPTNWDSPNTMQKVSGPIWNQGDLEKAWSHREILPGMLGFGHDGRWPDYGPCSGDSGGPLVCLAVSKSEGNKQKWLVAGVASFANHNCQRLPTVFTDTAFYADWINKNMV